MAKSAQAAAQDRPERDERMGRMEGGRYIPAPPIAREGEPPALEPPASPPAEPLPAAPPPPQLHATD